MEMTSLCQANPGLCAQNARVQLDLLKQLHYMACTDMILALELLDVTRIHQHLLAIEVLLNRSV